MKILLLSLDLELSQFRKAALSAAGHEATVVTSEKEALQAVQASDRFDAVLLCHHLPSATGRQAVRILRQHHPGTSIVYIVHVYGEWPEVEADRYVVGADGPEALLRVLAEITQQSQGVAEIGIP
jgi:CheY-like chemotaxis protein